MAQTEKSDTVRSGGRAAVAAVALATFTVVTSEMLPVGLLSPLSGTLGVTEGTAGLTLTVTGLVAALSAPLVAPALGRLDRRWALVALMGLVAAGNLLAAWSPRFAVMMAGRVLVGVGMGGVWVVAAGLAVRLVAPRAVAGATSSIFSGIAVASVLGVPAGAWLGESAGWRAAFAAGGALALVVAALLAVLLPPLPAGPAVRLGGVARLLATPALRTGLLVVAFLVTGHFAAYTYVRPVLEQISGVGAPMVGALLLAYGVAGVAGNFAAGAGAGRAPRATLLVLSGTLAAAVLLLPSLGAALLVVWGLAYGGVSVAAQTWVMSAVPAPEDREAGSALFAGVFNAAIALGALAGGRVADGFGVESAMWLGGALAAVALLVGRAGRG
ncbi:MFS transporter [Streptomyces sp. SP18CS02]|uniref:MFS transporter n=1 Tax=Streptomyces sp. SP18CS02 TaxID=3002531 RepID=UPI002E786811|nr:MFS transporter [Streptomyces sp. SP18CS02]MEE1755670.1 MFS transporter [Streptomyces sp. SP18CS02]